MSSTSSKFTLSASPRSIGSTSLLGAAASVAVAPDAQNLVEQPNQPRVFPFTVFNAGGVSGTFTLTALCRAPGVSSCTPSQTSVTLGAGAPAVVSVSYQTGASGSTGRVVLLASMNGASPAVIDSGWVNVSVEAPSAASVAVTLPNGTSVANLEPNTATSAVFSVANTGTGVGTFSLVTSCVWEGQPIVCTPSQTSVTLAASASQTVSVTYQSGGPTTTGQIALTATLVDGGPPVSARGTLNASTRTATASAVTVIARTVNPGTNIDRGECLTISAGDGAAYECGDLRLVHAMPTTSTMNKARTPVLMYNSRHAKPGALIAANVSFNQTITPNRLDVTVKVKRGPSDEPAFIRTFTWTGTWPADQVRRIAVPIDASSGSGGANLATGAYEYSFEVKAKNGSTTLATNVAVDTLVIVNRTLSEFGEGWWFSGLEQLISVDATKKLWVGGDGTTRLYKQSAQNGNVWLVDPSVDRIDTLLKVVRSSTTYWQRRLRNAAYVEFDNSGIHRATVNRLRDSTLFGRTTVGSYNVLSTITLPVPAGGTARTYTMAYENDAGGRPRLLSVTAPALPSQSRVVSVGYANTTTRRINRFTDPGGSSPHVDFRYSTLGLVDARRNRMNDTTFFVFDSVSQLLRQVTVDMRRTNALYGRTDATPTTYFCPADGKSLTDCPTNPLFLPSVIDTPQQLANVFTSVNGPRTDVADITKFFVNSWGAPDTVINAAGHQTRVRRTDARFPMLATGMIAPNGLETRIGLSPRALVLADTVFNPLGDGRNAITTYGWNGTFDMADTVVAPTGDTTFFHLDANGNREWQQDRRGSSTRVLFAYDSYNRLRSMRIPGNSDSQRDSIQYDSNLGNVSKRVSPVGVVTESFKDAVGRDTLLKTPTDAAQTESLKLKHRIVYDASERDSISVEWNGGDSLRVTNTFDAEDNLTEVKQVGRPDDASVGDVVRRYRYDAAGRKISERLVHGASPTDDEVMNWTYDAASNVTADGRGATMSYDELNRVTARGGTLPATFTYDATGLRTANNAAARISRSYYLNGQIATETQSLATADWSSFPHVYQLRYAYDLSGRKTRIDHPNQLAGSGNTARTDYAYEAETGLLSTITDKFGQLFSYQYDAAGRLTQMQSRVGNSPVTELRSYDAASRLTRRTSRLATNAVLHDDSLTYDARGKAVRVLHDLESQAQDTFNYDIRGRAKKSVLSGTTETIDLDGLGNIVESNTKTRLPVLTSSSYEAGSGRLTSRTSTSSVAGIKDSTKYQVDLRGDTYGIVSLTPSGAFTRNGINYQYLTFRSNSNDQFDETGKMISHTFTYDTLFHSGAYNTNTASESAPYSSREWYRYDALGRRVWTWSVKGATCNSSDGSPDKWTGCHDALTRTVWDGNQVLYEVRTEGNDATSASVLENDSPGGVFTGVVGYVHGYGIDEPVALDKGGDTVLPQADWRGRFDMGVCGTAKCATTEIKFPQRNVHGSPNWSGNAPSPSWYGTLIDGQVDASGYTYMRNRYFDPATGRFTTEDPIGLAGGLNLYGFAEGDPVNFSDPFGLCVGPAIVYCPQIVAGLIAAGAGLATWIATKNFTIARPGEIFLRFGKEQEQPDAEDDAAGDGAGKVRNPDGSIKDAGQHFEEITEAQRRARGRGRPDRINRTGKSSQRDQDEIEEEAQRTLEELRKRLRRQGPGQTEG